MILVRSPGFFCSALIVFILISPGQAEEPLSPAPQKHEISASTGSTIVVANNSDLLLNIGYGRSLGSGWQLSTDFIFAQELSDSNGPEATQLTLRAGPTFNFPIAESYLNAYFVRPQLSYVMGGGTSDSTATSLGASLGLGRRFALNQSLAYSPSIRFSMLFGDDFDDDVTTILTPIGFSFFF